MASDTDAPDHGTKPAHSTDERKFRLDRLALTVAVGAAFVSGVGLWAENFRVVDDLLVTVATIRADVDFSEPPNPRVTLTTVFSNAGNRNGVVIDAQVAMWHDGKSQAFEVWVDNVGPKPRPEGWQVLNNMTSNESDFPLVLKPGDVRIQRFVVSMTQSPFMSYRLIPFRTSAPSDGSTEPEMVVAVPLGLLVTSLSSRGDVVRSGFPAATFRFRGQALERRVGWFLGSAFTNTRTIRLFRTTTLRPDLRAFLPTERAAKPRANNE